LEELLREPPDFARFLTGSEGTLALTSRAELRTIPIPARTTLALFAFRSLSAASEAVSEFRASRPAALELIDRFLLEALKGMNSTLLYALGLDEAEASLWIEWEGEIPSGVPLGNAYVMENRAGQSSLWALYSKASKRLYEIRDRRVPLHCIDDGVVPLENLPEFVAGMREILKRHDCEGAIFGHAGDAHLHVSPRIDWEAPHVTERIEKLMEETYGFIWGLGGTISGENGDGYLRRRFAERQWAPVLPLFHLVKEVFDPAGILNPDKKFSLGASLLPPYRSFRIAGATARPLTAEEEAAELPR
jgi:FAD/FMN-containing dehydrogenase